MGYTVKDLLESNNFSEMQLISDDSGIGREIKGSLRTGSGMLTSSAYAT